MDAQHAGEPGFESLLRHFFKNLTQHLALPESPAGQTVFHPPVYIHKPVVKSFENRWSIRYSGKVIHWTIRKVVHLCWTNSLVDNPQVDKTTINPMYVRVHFVQEELVGSMQQNQTLAPSCTQLFTI